MNKYIIYIYAYFKYQRNKIYHHIVILAYSNVIDKPFYLSISIHSPRENVQAASSPCHGV